MNPFGSKLLGPPVCAISESPNEPIRLEIASVLRRRARAQRQARLLLGRFLGFTLRRRDRPLDLVDEALRPECRQDIAQMFHIPDLEVDAHQKEIRFARGDSQIVDIGLLFADQRAHRAQRARLVGQRQVEPGDVGRLLRGFRVPAQSASDRQTLADIVQAVNSMNIKSKEGKPTRVRFKGRNNQKLP